MAVVGATAVEDELQEDTRGTLQALRDAKIKVWMLTGDKLETAINIGHSTGLLTHQDLLLVLKPSSHTATREELEAFLAGLEREVRAGLRRSRKSSESSRASTQKTAPRTCASLSTAALSERFAKTRASSKGYGRLTQFCESTLHTSVVVAARITPGQKAEFVSMVRQRLPRAKTLAVGDGANDVNMICTAHVGVAIYGREGLQASTASDYSVPAFRMLKPLLLHNGTEFCRINQDYIYYNFYKNFLLSAPQIW